MQKTPRRIVLAIALITILCFVSNAWAIFCSKCGSENSDDAKFCYRCGQELSGGTKPAIIILNPDSQEWYENSRYDCGRIVYHDSYNFYYVKDGKFFDPEYIKNHNDSEIIIDHEESGGHFRLWVHGRSCPKLYYNGRYGSVRYPDGGSYIRTIDGLPTSEYKVRTFCFEAEKNRERYRGSDKYTGIFMAVQLPAGVHEISDGKVAKKFNLGPNSLRIYSGNSIEEHDDMYHGFFKKVLSRFNLEDESNRKLQGQGFEEFVRSQLR